MQRIIGAMQIIENKENSSRNRYSLKNIAIFYEIDSYDIVK